MCADLSDSIIVTVTAARRCQTLLSRGFVCMTNCLYLYVLSGATHKSQSRLNGETSKLYDTLCAVDIDIVADGRR